MLDNTQSSEHDDSVIVDEKKGTYGYILIALYVLLLYVVTIPFYVQYNNTVLPMGDPFTYTVGWFMKIDMAQEDYFAAFKSVFYADFYWLMNLMLFLFSPILVKEPFSLSLVNFVMFGLATLSFYRLARCLKFSEGFSFILAWLVWLYPIAYGFIDYQSIPVMGIDTLFIGILHIAVANTLVFAIEPRKIKNALLAAVSVGLAVWGRGNSVPVLLMVLFCPLALLVFKAWKEKGRTLSNFIIFCSLPLLMAAFYYKTMGQAISGYYQHHTRLVLRHHFNLADAMQWFKNMPGFLFWRIEDSTTTMAICVISHLTGLFAVFLSFRRDKRIPLDYRTPLKLLSVTGLFIYWVTYTTNIVMFTDKHFNIYNYLGHYGPIRIALVLSLFVIFSHLVLANGIDVKKWVMIPIAVFAVLYGVAWTKAQTPEPIAGIPSPQEVESFAKGLDGLTNGGTISMLWYRHYNPNILNYYRVKNNLSFIKIYRNTYYDNMWFPANHTEDDRIKVRAELHKQFEEASIIIMAEYLYSYGLGNPYALYQFRDEIPIYLNAPDSPRFVVRMILYEYGGERLLVLQREKDANGQGESLRLPYGPKPSGPIPPDYGKGVIKYKFDSSRCVNNILDKGIFFEKVGPYPHGVERKCNMQVVAKKYSAGAGPKIHSAHMRMPVAWKLQGSNDKTNWVDLDTRTEQTNWTDDEVRSFDIAKPAPYRYYRLYATAGVDPTIIRLYKFDLSDNTN